MACSQQAAGGHALPSTRRQPPHSLLLLILASLTLCSFGLMWGLPNLFDFAQDSVVPAGTLAQIGVPFEQITTYRYPPFHFIVLKFCFVPARALTRLAYFADKPKMSATLFILSARLVSLLMALGTVALLCATGRRLWSQTDGLAAGLLFVISPVTLYYAKNANLDVPYTFWLAASLFVFVKLLQEDRWYDYLRLGTLAALAVCTKDQAYGFVALMPLPLLGRLWKQGQKGLLRAGLGLAGFIIPFVAIHDIISDPEAFWRHIRMIAGPASEGWREFAPDPMGQLRLLVETVLRLMDAWTPSGLALVAVGLVVCLRDSKCRSNCAHLLVPAASYYLTFLAVVGYVYPRFVLPLMLVLSLFAGHGVAWLWRKGRAGKFAVTALAGWAAIAGLSVDYVMAHYPRFEAQKWLERNASTPKMHIRYIGDMRDMPRFNHPLDPQPVEATPEALSALQPKADLLVLSYQQGHPAAASKCWRLSSILRRNLGNWGRISPAPGGYRGFHEGLVAGEYGYRVKARFVSPISWFVPEVAESLNRTIIILERADAPDTAPATRKNS